MKKLFVYLAIPILLYSMQACNRNGASNEATGNDSITNRSTYNEDSAKERLAKQKEKKENVRKENATKQNTTAQDTSKKKNSFRIAATEVPDAVIAEFNNRYPNVANVKWVTGDKRGKTLYKARWQTNGRKLTAAFTEDGRFIKEKQPK